jgi:hypothetical protein
MLGVGGRGGSCSGEVGSTRQNPDCAGSRPGPRVDTWRTRVLSRCWRDPPGRPRRPHEDRLASDDGGVRSTPVGIVTADAGYLSKANLALEDDLEVELLIATRTTKDATTRGQGVRGRKPKNLSATQLMERKLRTQARRPSLSQTSGVHRTRVRAAATARHGSLQTSRAKGLRLRVALRACCSQPAPHQSLGKVVPSTETLCLSWMRAPASRPGSALRPASLSFLRQPLRSRNASERNRVFARQRSHNPFVAGSSPAGPHNSCSLDAGHSGFT